jgi:hypothetical protein
MPSFKILKPAKHIKVYLRISSILFMLIWLNRTDLMAQQNGPESGQKFQAGHSGSSRQTVVSSKIENQQKNNSAIADPQNSASLRASLKTETAGQFLSQTKQRGVPRITAGFVLIQTIATSAWSPPSPDPSGIAYIPDSGDLLICDGEID